MAELDLSNCKMHFRGIFDIFFRGFENFENLITVIEHYQYSSVILNEQITESYRDNKQNKTLIFTL